MVVPGPVRAGGAGRPPVTSRAELEHVALELFALDGFEATTVDRIAEAAGIGRRTFFRYYPSKNDLPWGEFDDRLAGLRATLAATPATVPLGPAITEAVVAFNAVPPAEEPWHRRRMALLLDVPALQAHGVLRHAAWRAEIAAFVGRRRVEPATAAYPRTVAHLALAAAVAAYESWLAAADVPLVTLLRASFALLEPGLDDAPPVILPAAGHGGPPGG